MTKRPAVDTFILYTPSAWTPDQRQFHNPGNLDHAFHQASSLAGGWYLRPVAIEYRLAESGDELYRLIPADEAQVAEWTRIYEIKAVR